MKCNMDPRTEKGISMEKLERLHRVCSLVKSIDLISAPWFCKTLTLGKPGGKVYDFLGTVFITFCKQNDFKAKRFLELI